MKRVKRTERGWAGHFCLAQRCLFRRNTLLECGKEKVVVSTVGLLYNRETNEIEKIGSDGYYECMVFPAIKKGNYWDADWSKTLESETITFFNEGSDQKANEMHEDMIKKFTDKMKKGE